MARASGEGITASFDRPTLGGILAKQGILIAFALFMIAFTIANPKFLSFDNVSAWCGPRRCSP